jgi:hypothetical protein
MGNAGESIFSLILGRSSLRGFCLFISEYIFDYRQKNPLKYPLSGSHISYEWGLPSAE